MVDYILCLFFFFFFKQKTAYEITTGDWSSDVCSSDLAAGVARAAVAHHSPAGRRDLPAGAARVRAGGVRGWTATGRGRADRRDGALAGDGGAGARGVRGAGAGRDAGAGDLGARRQRAGAALRGAGGLGAVRGAAPRAGGGRRAQRLASQECGRRAVVRTAEAVVAGLLLTGH